MIGANPFEQITEAQGEAIQTFFAQGLGKCRVEWGAIDSPTMGTLVSLKIQYVRDVITPQDDFVWQVRPDGEQATQEKSTHEIRFPRKYFVTDAELEGILFDSVDIFFEKRKS